MSTLDGDWQCEQEDLDGPICFAVWDHCEDCLKQVPELEWYNGGLVPKGQGLAMADEVGNMWYDQAAELGNKYDICLTCIGSGGGYICGVHDLGLPEPGGMRLEDAAKKAASLLDPHKAHVGVGSICLKVYVTADRREVKRLRSLLLNRDGKFEGWPMTVEWIGKVRPA